MVCSYHNNSTITPIINRKSNCGYKSIVSSNRNVIIDVIFVSNIRDIIVIYHGYPKRSFRTSDIAYDNRRYNC